MELWKLFGLNRKEDATREQGVLFAGLAGVLEGYDDTQTKMIAGIAGLLGTVAYADLDISDEEIVHIREVLESELKLTHREVESVVQILLEQKTRLFTIEDYLYIRLINEVANVTQKKALLGSLFALAAADGTVDLDEDVTVRKITNGLKLSHKDFIEARTHVNDKLSWVRK